MGYQYLGYSYYQMGQKQLEFAADYKDDQYKATAHKYFAEAISTALEGVQLDPNRAEFYVIAADSFIRQNQPGLAVPLLEAAAACRLNNFGGASGPIFQFADQYSYYPRLQLVKCLASLGDWDRTKKAVLELVELHPTEDAKKLLEEVEGFCKTNLIPSNTVQTDDIVISCPPGAGFFSWDGKTYRESFCGGSETAAVELAENLHKITGRKVMIFNDRKEPIHYEGVDYMPVSHLHGYLTAFKPYLHIAWRHPVKLTDAYTILWCHDLVTQGAENHANYDVLAALTPFHKRYIQARQGIPDSKIWVTRNGLNPS